MKMNRTNSCQKGKRVEREAAAYLRSLGFDARRGQQHAGGPDSPDVVVADLPHVHHEVKGIASMDIGTVALSNALAQATRDAGPDKLPVCLWKPLRKPWRLSWIEHGVQLTTADPDAIRATLHRLNACGNSAGPFSGVDQAYGETSRSSRQSFEERL